MKKVLLSAYACSPIRGSEPGNGWSWATTLAQSGFEVWCITNIEDQQATMDECNRLNLKNLHFVFVNISGRLDEYLLNTDSKTIYLHYYLWRQRASKVAKNLHDIHHFDVAHHVTFGSLQQGTFLWKLNDVKIVFGPVGGGQRALPQFKEYFGSSWKFEILRDVVSRVSLVFSSELGNTLRKADVVLVTNSDTQEMVRKTKLLKEDKLHFIIDNAVPKRMEQNVYVNREDKQKLRLLWVGRMLPRKGLKLVFHALSLVEKSVDYSLTIVGGGEQFHLVEDWIREYGLEVSRFNILGQVAFEQVIKSYQDADAFIFCSLRDSCPAQLNEAMAYGLPIITLDIHGSSLSVPENCGIKVKPLSAGQTANKIAEAIGKFHDNPEFRKSCSENAFQYAKQNTWKNKVSHVTERFY